MKYRIRLWMMLIGTASVLAVPAPLSEPAQRAVNEVAREFRSQPERGGLTLAETLKRTANANLAIQSARTQIEESAGGKLLLRARALPKAALYGLGGRQGHRNETKARNFAVLAERSQIPLFDMAVPASWREGDIVTVMAQHQVQKTMVDELHRTRKLYYEMLFYHALIQLEEQQKELLSSNLQKEEERLSNGVGTRGEVVRAKIQSLNLIPEITEAQNRYRQTQIQFAQALNLPMGKNADQLPSASGLLAYEPFSIVPQKEVDYALAHRPDLKLLANLIERAEAERNIAAAGYYPQIIAAVDGEYIPKDMMENVMSNSTRDDDDSQNSEVRFRGVLTWTAEDFGETGGQVLSRESAVASYRHTLDQLKQNVPRDIARILRAIKTEQAKIESVHQAVELAEENVKQVESQIAVGEKDQLDFLDAQSSLFQMKFTLLESLYRYNLALAEFDRATGRYVQSSQK